MIVHGSEINVARKGGVLIVGEAWGEFEAAADPPRPFIGPAGMLLDDVLAYGGFRREDVNLTNVVCARPPSEDNRFESFRDDVVAEGRAALDALVRKLQPKLVITTGNIPSAHFVPTWPTNGRGIVRAKDIENRRGYFWPGRHGGWVLTCLHPAAALRKAVPGYELLTRDMKRAKAWLRGKLPRQRFPDVLPLRDMREVKRLLRSSALAFDIETRWQHIVTCGFCGDDGQPYAARYGKGFDLMRHLLTGRVGLEGVAHNGYFDVDQLDREGYPTALYTDDSMTAWWALDPELAAQSDEEGGRMTKKSLAFLGSLDENGNFPWWKDDDRADELGGVAGYPQEGDDDRLALFKLYNMGGRDSFITHRSWKWLKPRMHTDEVQGQYRDAYRANLACITMTRRGWRVDDDLRRERITALTARHQEAREKARAAGLAYVEEQQIQDFLQTKQCTCCGGGKVAAQACWRCAGFERKPTKAMLLQKYADPLGDLAALKKDQLEAFVLKPCTVCGGKGKTEWYDFQPTTHQLKKLLYEHIGAPKWVFKRKTKMDEMARINLMLWAKGEK
jgi:uracil-DNA glycosylase family 4